jgi:hypothetical protein
MRVVAGADNAGRFVDRNVDLALDRDGLAGDGNMIFVGLDLRAESGDPLAVDGNFAFLDQFLAMSAGADARFREELLKADESSRR